MYNHEECEYRDTFQVGPSLPQHLEIRRDVIVPAVDATGVGGVTPSVLFLNPQENIYSTTLSVIVHMALPGEYAYLYKEPYKLKKKDIASFYRTG